jgi:hypothetical protein
VATAEEKSSARERLQVLLDMPADTVADQDDRVFAMAEVILDYPQIFGEMGYYLAGEILKASNAIEVSEFRRAFVTEYEPAFPMVRDYLRRLAGLRRRALNAKYDSRNVPMAKWGTAERRSGAKEQMELVQQLPDCYFMEKYWRTLEIVCAYPDLFDRKQYDQLVSNKAIEQTWKAHLGKAREDWNYYKIIVKNAGMTREIVDSAIKVLQEMAGTTIT